MKRDSD